MYIERTYRHTMKGNKTSSEYTRRINLAIKFISDNINSRISLDDVASASFFSPYHFHRIFHSIVGETVNDFIIRKRMELAASRIVCKSELSITEISTMGGFSSSANFSKAFKLYFGVTPGQLRNPARVKSSKIGKIYSKYGKEFDPQSLYSQFVTETEHFNSDTLEKLLMNIKVQDLDARHVAYLTTPGGYELESIFNTWDKLSSWAVANGIHDHETRRYAILHDNPMVTPVDKCRYDATVEIDPSLTVAAPFATQLIPAGKYGVAYYKGDGDKVGNFYMELYSKWLPNSGFEPDDYPPLAHYLNDSRVDGFVEMEAWIKIKTLNKAS